MSEGEQLLDFSCKGNSVSNGYIAIARILDGRLNVPDGTIICIRGGIQNPFIGKRVVLTEKRLDFRKGLEDFRDVWITGELDKISSVDSILLPIKKRAAHLSIITTGLSYLKHFILKENKE
jgi:hypothetical protein